MKPYLLAHDLGTSGDKATLFDTEGRVIASRTSGYQTFYGQGNRAEQDPGDWWKAVCATTRAITEQIDKNDIGAVSLSGQMMGCLCVDKKGRPLRNSLIYSDQRAVREAQRLGERIDAGELYRITGHRPSASYSLEKLMWIKENEPDLYRLTHRILNAKDFVNFKLCGRFLTDFNDASGTNCFDINSLQWSSRIVELAGIDEEMLPEGVESVSLAGGVTGEAASATGLAADTPVIVGAGDGGCATVGAGCVSEGRCYNYLGSTAWISTAMRRPLFEERMRTFTFVHPVPGLYQPCGTVQTAGSAVSWLAAALFGGHSRPPGSPGARPSEDQLLEAINREAEESQPGANGVIFLPYLLGERSPRWNPNAKGAWIGLKLSNRRSDLARAVLEGVACNLEIVLSIFRAELPVRELLLIGGGARSAVWRRILSDVYGLPILVPSYLEEATSMGAAIIGGVGIGAFDFEEGVKRFVTIDERIEPDVDAIARYNEIKPLFEACYASLETTMGKL